MSTSSGRLRAWSTGHHADDRADRAAAVTLDKRTTEVSAEATPADNSSAPDAAPTETTRTKRRDDLDGLRGIAIAMVVIGHVWFGRVTGGVDAFLVLSGFFFTGMVVRRIGRGGSPVTIMTNTMRRLLPALLTVLAAIAVTVALIRPPTQWASTSDQILASALYFQNWYLAETDANYLAADVSVSPMQHLWSMSIQGQFFLAAAILISVLIWVTRRFAGAHRVRPVLTVVFVAVIVWSFVYAAIGVEAGGTRAYYDTGARVWEMLLGGLLALWLPSIRLPMLLRRLLALVGIGFLVTCGYFLDGASLFPGPWALWPVLATCAMILAGAGGDYPGISRMLATRPMVELGALAYSLYLWHWPILIFWMVHFDLTRVGVQVGLGIIGASLVLAYATNRWIEEPLRAGRTPAPIGEPGALRGRIGRGVAVGLTVVTTITAIGSATLWQLVMVANPTEPAGTLDARQYPGAAALLRGVDVPDVPMRPTVYEAPAELPASTKDGCIADWETTDAITCSYGDLSATRVLALAGSSHAEHWLTAFDALGKTHNFRVDVYLKMGCPLTVATSETDDVFTAECRAWSAQAIDMMAASRPDWVFTTATRPKIPEGGDEVPPDYMDVWHRLGELGLDVIAIRDTPWLRTEDGIWYRANDCLAQGGSAESCGIPRDRALSPVNPAIDAIAQFPNVHGVDLTDGVCGQLYCRAVEGNVLVYHDEHHLSASYVRTLAPELWRQVGPITGWG